MAELPSMIQDLALMLVVAGIVTLIFKKLIKQWHANIHKNIKVIF